MMGGLTETQKAAELCRLFKLIEKDQKAEGGYSPSATSNASSSPVYGCSGKTLTESPANQKYLSYLEEVTAAAETAYADDGAPAIFATQGTNGQYLCGYRWAPKESLIPSTKRQGFAEKANGSEPEDVLPDVPTHKTGAPGVRSLFWASNYQSIDWSKVKGVLIHSHGITESARTGLIRCRATETVLGADDDKYTAELTTEQQEMIRQEVVNNEGYAIIYRKSWPARLTESGYVLFALDHQGHGLSDGWRSERCNVERLSHLVEDLIELTRSLVLGGEIPQTAERNVPLFLSGLSLGGLITVRALERGFGQGLWQHQNQRDTNRPRIWGACLLCPAISGERLKKKFPNQILLPIMSFISRATPSMRAVSLQNDTPFPFINAVISKDPYVYSKKLPIRISAESVSEMDCIMDNAHTLPADLRVLLVQSKFDTMTDPEGSAKFISAISATDKTSSWLDYSWHWLAREPGYGKTISLVIDWLDAKKTYPQPVDADTSYSSHSATH